MDIRSRIPRLFTILALLSMLAPAANAQIVRIELDIDGYLCGF